MAEDPIGDTDQQAICVARFEQRLRAELKPLVTDALIDEHRRSVKSRRSDSLERILTYFRRATVANKYAIWAVKPFAEYRIVALSGRRGVPPRVVDEITYATPEEASHAVFLRRIAELKKS